MKGALNFSHLLFTSNMSKLWNANKESLLGSTYPDQKKWVLRSGSDHIFCLARAQSLPCLRQSFTHWRISVPIYLCPAVSPFLSSKPRAPPAISCSWISISWSTPQLLGKYLSIGIDPRDGLKNQLELHVLNLESGVESIHLAYFPMGKSSQSEFPSTSPSCRIDKVWNPVKKAYLDFA